MANLTYISENRILSECAAEKAKAQRVYCAIGVPVLLFLTLTFISARLPFGILGAWLTFVVLYRFVSQSAIDRRKIQGGNGENYTLEILSKLPDDYTIFNQVPIHDDRSRTGSREMDFVVCGPNGVFVIETKDYNGGVIGNADDKEWTIRKIGAGGARYEKSARNPVRQVRMYVTLLANYLKTKGASTWVTGMVALSRDNCLDEIVSPQIPVLQATDIAELIRNIKKRQAPPPEAVHLIEDLVRSNRIWEKKVT